MTHGSFAPDDDLTFWRSLASIMADVASRILSLRQIRRQLEGSVLFAHLPEKWCQCLLRPLLEKPGSS